MKKAEITEGGTYMARVSGQLVVVRVDRIVERTGVSPRGKTQLVYEITNLRTMRRLVFRSAAKFRRSVTNKE